MHSVPASSSSFRSSFSSSQHDANTALTSPHEHLLPLDSLRSSQLKPAKQAFVNAYDSFLDLVSKPAIEEITYKITQKLYPEYMVPPLVASFDQCINTNQQEEGAATASI